MYNFVKIKKYAIWKVLICVEICSLKGLKNWTDQSSGCLTFYTHFLEYEYFASILTQKSAEASIYRDFVLFYTWKNEKNYSAQNFKSNFRI